MKSKVNSVLLLLGITLSIILASLGKIESASYMVQLLILSKLVDMESLK